MISNPILQWYDGYLYDAISGSAMGELVYKLYPEFSLKFVRNTKIRKKNKKTGILYSHQVPNFGVKIPHTRFKITLYTVYPQTLADPVQCCQFWFSFSMSRLWYVNHTSNGITFWKLGCSYFGPTRSEPFLFCSVRSVIQERNCRSCLRLLLMNWSNIPSWAISFFS